MWGRRKQQQVDDRTTLIAGGTEVSGDVRFSGHLEIEGVVKGNIRAAVDSENAFVRVLRSGRVEGEVQAPEVVINGRVSGDVHGLQHVELAENAVVDGDVHYHLIEMVKGAQVNGNLVHTPPPSTISSARVAATAERDTKANTGASSSSPAAAPLNEAARASS